MSIQASIEIQYQENIHVFELLDILQSDGWTFNDYGKISFLINDDFDWERFDLEDIEIVNHLIQEKLTQQKTIGIAMVNKQIDSGGLFHFDKDKLWILFSIDRKCIDNSNYTDYSLYIKYLRGILNDTHSILCQDVF